MSQQNRMALKARVCEPLASDDWIRFCDRVIDFILDEIPDPERKLRMEAFQRFTPAGMSEREMASALMYLASDACRVLELGFEYRDPDGHCELIEPSEARRVVEHGFLTHPRTGSQVHARSSDILFFLRPGLEAIHPTRHGHDASPSL